MRGKEEKGSEEEEKKGSPPSSEPAVGERFIKCTAVQFRLPWCSLG